MVRNRALRVVLMGLGLLFVGIGFVGAFVPLIPTTGPVLLAAFLFSISSVRFDHWLTNHRIFGSIVRDWRAGRGFTMRLKMTAVVAIAVTFTITVGFAIDNTVIRVSLIALAISLVTYILQLPTKPREPAAIACDQ